MAIVVNNNDTNVNISCSTGFYIVVAQPYLSSIGKGTVGQFSSVQVVCTEVMVKSGQAGVSDVSRMSFTLEGPNISARVSVHLRHTTRLIQVQGSAKMPDNMTAAVWFTENCLTHYLRKVAKAKQFDITAFNQKILSMSQSHDQTIKSGKYCGHCTKLFNLRSRPSPCLSCDQKIHQNCLKPHSASCTQVLPHVSQTLPNTSPTRTANKRPRISSTIPLVSNAPTPPHPSSHDIHSHYRPSHHPYIITGY